MYTGFPETAILLLNNLDTFYHGKNAAITF
jgi:hypothetical protein